MKLCSRANRPAGERGAALLLSLLILLVLVAIVIQINVSTGTDARVGRNDVTLTTMDLAAESALLQVAESLKTDAEGDAAGSAGEGLPTGSTTGTNTPGQPTDAQAGAAPGAQQPAQPVDSRRDEWATAQRTEINGIRLRIITQDENSKYNVLNLLNPDEKEAQAAFDRVVRILDACREGTQYDIDPRTAEEMAKTMREHMTKRRQSSLPRAKLLTDDEKNDDQGLPLSLREFMPLQPFEELHFKDFRDQDQRVVHSIASFLTVWTALSTNPLASSAGSGSNASAGSNASSSGSSASAGSSTKSGSNTSTSSATTSPGKSGAGSGGESKATDSGATAQAGSTGAGANSTAGTANAAAAGGGSPGASPKASPTTGGYGVNVNTAPAAVLKSLFDGREVPGRFWDKVIEYRNLEDEEETKKQEEQSASDVEQEEQLDEYGQPILKRRIFTSLSDLSKVDGWDDLPTEFQTKLMQLLTVQSEVFSVFVIARKPTSAEDQAALGFSPAEMRKREETRGDSLQRVVHSVLWRQKAGSEVQIAPVLRWEIVDYLPYEVLDFPPDDR